MVGTTDKRVTGPPAFVESGHMFPARLPAPVVAEVEAYVAAVLDAVGLRDGLSHADVMPTDAGPRLVELNPRQGGGYIFDLVELVTGTNPLRLLVDLALGTPAAIGTAAAPLPAAAVPGGSAAVVFVMAPRAGSVAVADGLDALRADPRVVRAVLPLPAQAARPVDSEAYLGHVVVADAGGDARAHAEALVGLLRLRMADGAMVAPPGVPSGLG